MTVTPPPPPPPTSGSFTPPQGSYTLPPGAPPPPPAKSSGCWKALAIGCGIIIVLGAGRRRLPGHLRLQRHQAQRRLSRGLHARLERSPRRRRPRHADRKGLVGHRQSEHRQQQRRRPTSTSPSPARKAARACTPPRRARPTPGTIHRWWCGPRRAGRSTSCTIDGQ